VRVLVTGGSGFIGSHVVDKLCEHGVTPRVFDLTPPRQDVEYYQGSILQVDQLRAAMGRVDAVMHLAAIADVKDVFENPHYSEQVNVRGTVNVVEAMRTTGIKRIVYGSTTWVYETAAAEQVDELTPLGVPQHLYTATKLTGEYYCRTYANLYGLEPTILRYGIPYGPRARSAGVIALFVNKALRGEPITITGDGMQFRKFIYVEDLAEGNVLGLRSVAKNSTYNLDGGEKITIRQLAETIQSILGKVEIQYLPARPGDFSGKEISSAKAKKELGWEASTSLEDGVRRYLKWVEQEDQDHNRRWATVDPQLKD